MKTIYRVIWIALIAGMVLSFSACSLLDLDEKDEKEKKEKIEKIEDEEDEEDQEDQDDRNETSEVEMETEKQGKPIDDNDSNEMDISNAGFEWEIYDNDRYGYSLSYPDIYDESFESDNGDGIVMNSSDGKYSLTIWAANNIDGDDGYRLLELAKNRVAYISYETSTDNFYNLAYEGGGEEQSIQFVESGYVNDDHAVYYVISYPADEIYEFTDVLLRMDNELYID